MKYVPDFPERFGSLEDARAFCEGFFLAYNHEHRHSGVGMHTPASVHFGTAEQIQTQRRSRSAGPTPRARNASTAGHDRPSSPKWPGSTSPSTSYSQSCRHNPS